MDPLGQYPLRTLELKIDVVANLIDMKVSLLAGVRRHRFKNDRSQLESQANSLEGEITELEVKLHRLEREKELMRKLEIE